VSFELLLPGGPTVFIGAANSQTLEQLGALQERGYRRRASDPSEGAPCEPCPHRARCAREAVCCEAFRHYAGLQSWRPSEVGIDVQPIEVGVDLTYDHEPGKARTRTTKRRSLAKRRSRPKR
jgi:hypothetical protein